MKTLRKRWGYFLVGIGLVLFVAALGQFLNRPGRQTTVLLGAMTVCFVSGGLILARRQEDIVLAVGDGGQTKTAAGSSERSAARPDRSPNGYLYEILTELSRMQSSDVLLERYDLFVRLIERVLRESIGRCEVALWCPDRDREHLIECVIREDVKRAVGGPTARADLRNKKPCKIPLTNATVKHALAVGDAYLNIQPPAERERHAQNPATALLCDACVPLYRNHGQPLLVCIELIPSADVLPTDTDKLSDNFQTTVRLIRLFWNYLQVTNQRLWKIEHEPDSGVLRAEAFLDQAQALAELCRQQDEPFAVVVFTVRGFRRMFAGQARQWQILSALVGRSLKNLLKENDREVLLGRMADDVFALVLTRTDKFLARSIMDKLVVQLEQRIRQDEALEQCDILALDFQWHPADAGSYRGSLEDLLNQIYRHMFERSGEKECYDYQIMFDQAGEDYLTHAGSR